jgi:hypothetical protein
MNRKEIRKKCIKQYRKTVVRIVYKLLKGSREQADVEFAGRVVTEMINQFTEYLFSFDKEVMTAKEQDHLANIINENLLKIGGKVDSYTPEKDDLLYCAMMLGKMIIKTNQLIADND